MTLPDSSRHGDTNYTTYRWFGRGDHLPDPTPEELAADEAWRKGAEEPVSLEIVTALEQDVELEIAALPEDLPAAEVLTFIKDLNYQENAGAIRNNGNKRIALGLSGHHAVKAGWITYKQLTAAMLELDAHAWQADDGDADTSSPHERDWAERAAHDRLDE